MRFVTTRVSAVAIKGDNPIFGESVTHIELCDEADGLFIKLSQTAPELANGEVTFNNAEEILAIGNAARELLRDAKKEME